MLALLLQRVPCCYVLLPLGVLYWLMVCASARFSLCLDCQECWSMQCLADARFGIYSHILESKATAIYRTSFASCGSTSCSSPYMFKSLQYLTFKSLYLWEGDCGGSGGKKSAPSKFVEESGKASGTLGRSNFVEQDESAGAGASMGVWTAHTVDKGAWKNKGAMRTTDIKIDTIFNGGFCVKFKSVNAGSATCDNFAVEVNMNPDIYKLQKHTTSLRKISENPKKGAYLPSPQHTCLCDCMEAPQCCGSQHRLSYASSQAVQRG
jgi:hypothetical protein